MTLCKLDTVYKLRAAVTRHRVIADTTRELEQSSDRALAEMGIARGDIAAVAAGSGLAPRPSPSQPAPSPAGSPLRRDG